MNQHGIDNKSKAMLASAAKELRKAKISLQNFQAPDYYFNVLFDSIYSFEFALSNGISIIY